MPNDQFHFKQFTVSQTGSTLKVCTDSCLFGAWVANHSSSAKQVLDIGTGTGLLALMYAQRHSSSIVSALEIDLTSAQLAQYNFDQSPWASQLKTINSSLQEYCTQGNANLFDVIVCNPPFFEKQLTSVNETKNLAKHSTQLSKAELVEGIKTLLSENGETYILLPPFEADEFSNLAASAGLFLGEKVTVRNKQLGNEFRQMMRFEKTKKETLESEMTIYESDKVYSPAFVELLKNYYLYL